MERKKDIDAAKGILIIAVISIHVSARLLLNRHILKNTISALLDTSDYLWIVFREILDFAVPGFLFLSGYMLAKKYEGHDSIPVFDFYKKRLTRIYAPFFFWWLVYKCCCDKWFSLINTMKSIIFLDGHFHFWFLWLIFISYLFFPMIYYLIKKYPVNYFIVGIILSVISNNYYTIFSSTSLIINYVVKQKLLVLPVNIMYFSSGILYVKYIRNRVQILSSSRMKDKNFLTIFIGVMAFLVLIKTIHFIGKTPIFIDNYFILLEMIYNLLAIAGVVLLVRFFSDKLRYITNYLTAVGCASYGIYLSHMLILYQARALFEKYLPNTSTLFALMTFISCLLLSSLPTFIQNKKLNLIAGF